MSRTSKTDYIMAISRLVTWFGGVLEELDVDHLSMNSEVLQTVCKGVKPKRLLLMGEPFSL